MKKKSKAEEVETNETSCGDAAEGGDDGGDCGKMLLGKMPQPATGPTTDSAQDDTRSGVARLPIAVLKPDPRNPRAMSADASAGLAVSLETFGALDIVFNDRTGELVSGHQRVRTLREAGATEFVRDGSLGYIEHPKTGDRFPVRFVDWDETKQRMGNLVANNHELQGAFTADAIEQLAEIEGAAEFEALRLDEMRRQLEAQFAIEEEATEGECDPDDVPEEPTEPISKRGDLWILGEHRLMCGDSTSTGDVGRLMGGAKADMLITDPPYGVSYVGKTADALTIENDNLSEDSLAPFIESAFASAECACRPGAYWYASVPPGPIMLLFADDWKRRGILRQILIWAKDAMVLGHSEYHYKHEPILFGWMKGERKKNSDRSRTSVWEFARPKSSKEHPTMKPVELWSNAITDGSSRGDTVLDLFCGSGTSIIAAERLGRRCFAMELEPKYVDMIVARWEKFTGKRAVRADA